MSRFTGNSTKKVDDIVILIRNALVGADADERYRALVFEYIDVSNGPYAFAAWKHDAAARATIIVISQNQLNVNSSGFRAKATESIDYSELPLPESHFTLS